MKAISMSKQALVAAVFGAAGAGALVYAPALYQQADARQPISIEPPAGAPMSFADLIEKVSPAVVSVNVVSEREVGGMGNMEEFFERFRGLPGFDDYMREREEEEGQGEEDEPQTREARSLGSGGSSGSAFSARAWRGGTASRSTSMTVPAWWREIRRASSRTWGVSTLSGETTVRIGARRPVCSATSLRSTTYPARSRPAKRALTRTPGCALASSSSGTRYSKGRSRWTSPESTRTWATRTGSKVTRGSVSALAPARPRP